MRDLQKMIGENINQYTRFYPKTYPPHGIPTDCPQPLGRMLECSELTFGLLGKTNYPFIWDQTRPSISTSSNQFQVYLYVIHIYTRSIHSSTDTL